MDTTKKKRKLYKIEIDNKLTNTEGVEKMALVEQPAIEVNWLAFSKQNADKYKFSASPDQQMLSGPFMIPELAIFRHDDELGDYDVTFSADTIRLAMKKFFRNSSPLAINHEHSSQAVNAYVVESWIVEDPASDKSTLLGFSLPKGTWFGTIFVEDTQYWQDYVKTGKVKGFSVEGMMKLAMSKIELSTQTNNSNMKIDFSTLTKRVFASAKTKDGLTIQTTDPNASFEKGVAVVAVDETGNQYDLKDGDYNLEDGTVLTVVEGAIDTVVAPVAQAADPNAPAPAATDAPATDFQAAIDALKAEITTALQDLSDRITVLETEEATEPAHATEMASLKAELAKVSESVAKFAKAPAAKPLNKESEKTVTSAKVEFSTKPTLKISELIDKVK